MFRKILSALLIGAMLLTMAVPALAETLYGTVVTPTKDGAAYVRRVAGAGQPIVGSAKNGDQLIILKKGNTWHRVKVVRTGVSGWMYGDYVRFSAATTDINQPGKVASSAGYANFRTGAGTDSTVISRLNNGSQLNVISKTGSWYYVYHAASGNYGYVSANLVSLTADDTGVSTATATVQSSDGFANLRKGPSTNYGIVAPLYNGTAVEIVRFAERDDEVVEVDATIYCERNSHKGIIIGKGGAMLKKVSSLARKDMEKFMGTKIFLQTWVKVKENWRDNPAAIQNFGYKGE